MTIHGNLLATLAPLSPLSVLVSLGHTGDLFTMEWEVGEGDVRVLRARTIRNHPTSKWAWSTPLSWAPRRRSTPG